jgi:hypothetical protein
MGSQHQPFASFKLRTDCGNDKEFFMTRRLRSITFVALILALATTGWNAGQATVSAQYRLQRAPERDLERTPTLPAGTRVIPQGWPITLEMETPLSSATARISDRFRARVLPVTDDTGRLLIQEGTYVEGHVIAVSKAKWAHRSGYIAIAFDNLRTSTNRIAPVRAILTSADGLDRKRLDEEGAIKGGNPTRRDVIFIGGGAGAGAAIGVFTGGALVGGAIGAAVGLTATMLMKGKEAVVDHGQLFAMELVQPFSLSQLESGRIYTPIYGGPPTSGIPEPVGPRPGPLDPRDVTVERMADGTVQLRINVETPTPGWRVYTHHDDLGALARIRLRGVPLSRGTTNGFYQTPGVAPAPLVCLNDRAGILRRVEILGRNGAVRIVADVPPTVGTRFARATPRVVQPRPIPVNPGGSGAYRPINPPYYNQEIGQPGVRQPPIATAPIATGSVPPPVSGTTAAPGTAPALTQSVINQVEVIRMQYAGDIGYLREANGNFRFIGARPPTQAQKDLLDNLGALLNSLTTLRANLGSPSQRSSALRVQEDAQSAQRLWLQVPLSADLNRKWSAAYRDTGTLLNSTAR